MLRVQGVLLAGGITGRLAFAGIASFDRIWTSWPALLRYCNAMWIKIEIWDRVPPVLMWSFRVLIRKISSLPWHSDMGVHMSHGHFSKRCQRRNPSNFLTSTKRFPYVETSLHLMICSFENNLTLYLCVFVWTWELVWDHERARRGPESVSRVITSSLCDKRWQSWWICGDRYILYAYEKT